MHLIVCTATANRSVSTRDHQGTDHSHPILNNPTTICLLKFKTLTLGKKNTYEKLSPPAEKVLGQHGKRTHLLVTGDE